MSALDKRLSMIINPCAGKKRIVGALADVIGRFNRAGYECTVYMTAAAGEATVYAAERCADADLVVCAGGDGTLNEVINGLMKAGLRVPVGYIPAGSTNDFANSIGLSSDISEAVDDIISGSPRKLDLGLINGRYFTYVISAGLFTKTTYTTPQDLKNILGHAAYVLEGIKDLGSITPMELTVDCGEKKWSGEYILCAVCNSTSLGGVVKIDPSVVDMNDGLFELLFIRMPHSLDELLRITNAITRKSYAGCELIDFVSAPRVTVTSSQPLDWTLDGELCRCGEQVTVENVRDALTIMTKGGQLTQ